MKANLSQRTALDDRRRRNLPWVAVRPTAETRTLHTASRCRPPRPGAPALGGRVCSSAETRNIRNASLGLALHVRARLNLRGGALLHHRETAPTDCRETFMSKVEGQRSGNTEAQTFQTLRTVERQMRRNSETHQSRNHVQKQHRGKSDTQTHGVHAE